MLKMCLLYTCILHTYHMYVYNVLHVHLLFMYTHLYASQRATIAVDSHGLGQIEMSEYILCVFNFIYVHIECVCVMYSIILYGL